MKPAVLLAVLLSALALSGCSAQGNEGACKDFESAYRASGLQDYKGPIASPRTDYGQGLKQVADAAAAGTAKASGDVKGYLQEIVDESGFYSSAMSSKDSPYSATAVRMMVETSRDLLGKACEKAGTSIHLGPVNGG